MTAPAPQSQPTWCPACSREVAGPCHLFNCSIGPNGLTTLTRCQPEAAPLRQHTPTPWMTHRAGEMLPDDWMIMADLGKLPNGIQQVSTVARALSIRQTPETTAANAAFIVEAVNSHATLQARVEELTKALQNVMGAYDTPLSRRRFPPDDFMREALESGRSALSLDKSGGAT